MYYNDQLYSGASTPKPLLKIGEPFVLRFEVTCYKKNFLAVQLLSIGNDDFDIINGPTSSLGTGTRGVIEANETRVFEWTVAPNEEWAGGSAPIDFYYQMTDLDTPKTIEKGEFTAAYVTISEEYYDGSESTAASSSNSEDESSSSSTPAFTALFTGFALVLAVIYKRK
jgi:MAST domain-containing protein